MPEMNRSPRNNVEDYIAHQFDDLASDEAMFPTSVQDSDWEWQSVARAVGSLDEKKILDVGCGKGKFCQALVRHGADAYGIDISNKLLEVARTLAPNIPYSVGSATSIPFPDNFFDAVICIEVLEHVPDTEAGLREMTRVVKPGGSVIIVDKNIIGLHPIWQYPTGLQKIWRESRGQWMYPKDSPFKERWFTPWGLQQQLRKYVSSVSIAYPEREKFFLNSLRRIVPWFSYDILWKGVK